MTSTSQLTRTLSFALAGAALILSGCAVTPQARFYTLSPMAPQQADRPVAEGQKIVVNISPVELPDALNRLQIVTREGRNEMKLAEFDRWAGSLNENISLVLAENLAMLLGSEQVIAYPRVQAASPDCTLAVRVLQLDCTPGDQVQLKAQWTIIAGTERKEAITRVTTYTEMLADKQYPTLVAAVSRALEQLSREIARAIVAKPAARQ